MGVSLLTAALGAGWGPQPNGESLVLRRAQCPHLVLQEGELALLRDGDAGVPGGAAGQYLLARICRATSRFKAAARHLAAALQLDPLLWCAYEELCALGARASAMARGFGAQGWGHGREAGTAAWRLGSGTCRCSLAQSVCGTTVLCMQVTCHSGGCRCGPRPATYGAGVEASEGSGASSGKCASRPAAACSCRTADWDAALPLAGAALAPAHSVAPITADDESCAVHCHMRAALRAPVARPCCPTPNRLCGPRSTVSGEQRR
jgi:hypothetical protein